MSVVARPGGSVPLWLEFSKSCPKNMRYRVSANKFFPSLKMYKEYFNGTKTTVYIYIIRITTWSTFALADFSGLLDHMTNPKLRKNDCM